MKQKTQRVSLVTFHTTHSFGYEWDDRGQCFELRDDGTRSGRRQDMDWGTPNGDLLFDPWIQKALTGGTRQ